MRVCSYNNYITFEEFIADDLIQLVRHTVNSILVCASVRKWGKLLSLLIFFSFTGTIYLVYVVVQRFIFHTAKVTLASLIIPLQTFVVFLLHLYFW